MNIDCKLLTRRATIHSIQEIIKKKSNIIHFVATQLKAMDEISFYRVWLYCTEFLMSWQLTLFRVLKPKITTLNLPADIFGVQESIG